MPNTMHTHRRQFVRDGEVPVTVVHHDEAGGTNKLEAVRQTLREQSAAREQAQQQLAEARATIQALETQLAHERIAKEETLRRAEVQRQELEGQLEEERATRQQAEQERDKAIVDRREAEEQLRAMVATQTSQATSNEPQPAERARRVTNADPTDQLSIRGRAISGTPPTKDGTASKRRGRPPKVRKTESEFVEWWKPGWRERLK
jgi:chromosome segregation ATPase